MRYKGLGLKKRLAKANRQTKYAPFWVSFRKFGLSKGRHVHPAQYTVLKRFWRRHTRRLN